MKRFYLGAAMALSLAACGADATPGAEPVEAISAMTRTLPTFTGEHVWDVNAAESSVSFEAFYNGTFTGEFKRFGVAIKLDPKAPEIGEIFAIVDLSSVQTKDDDVKANLPLADWFDVNSYPYATFKSSDITGLQGDNFKAKGELTLKGITKPAVLTFGLEVQGSSAHAMGGFELSRLDYNVGTGSDFETEDWVRFPVKVMVDIKATK